MISPTTRSHIISPSAVKRFRPFQAKFRLTVGAAAVSAVLLISIIHKTRLLISPSKSLPYSVFLLLKGVSGQKGDFITIQGHKTAYFEDLLFTKQIVGVPGDAVSFKEGFVWINGRKAGLFLTVTKKGKPLTPLKTRAVPQGYLFVMGEDERSFDSRYEEFGLVAEKHILGKTLGLF